MDLGPGRDASASLRIAFAHNLQTEATECQAEFDTRETVRMIADGLRRAGHTVFPVEVSGPVQQLVDRLLRLQPDLIFNTAEGRRGRCREGFYPALFDELGIPYTGSDGFVCAVTLDKWVTKSIAAACGVRTPRSLFVTDPNRIATHNLRCPLMVKPNYEGSSIGITVASVVETGRELRARVVELLSRFPDGVLVEEYIDGVDVVVPYLEGASPATGGVLSPASYSYRLQRNQARQIYDYQRKMDGFSDRVVEIPANISQYATDAAIRASRTIVSALRIRDVARFDYRLDRKGRLYFLEVNALPSLERGASIYGAARLLGIPSVEGVLATIVGTACARNGISVQPCKTKTRAVGLETWASS